MGGKSGAGKQPRIDVLTSAFGLKQLSTGSIFRGHLQLFGDLNYEGDLSRFYDPSSGVFIDAAEIKDALGISDRENADDIILGLEAKYYIEKGLFVPDQITNALFESDFRAMGYRGAVLDGYPRTLQQASYLEELAERKGIRLDAILLVENDDESIIKRTTGRRICRHCGAVYHMEYRPPPPGGCGGDADRRCELIQRSDDTAESLRARLQEFRNKAKPAIDYLTGRGIPLFTVPGHLPDFTPEAVKASVFAAMKIG